MALTIELECESHPDSPQPCCDLWNPETKSCDRGYEEVTIPSKFEVCPRCNGKGVHDHPAFSNGITSDEWNGPDWDDDSREGYLSGRYDVPCSKCNGLRVVEIADFSKMDATLGARVEDHFNLEARYAAEARAEARMGY